MHGGPYRASAGEPIAAARDGRESAAFLAIVGGVGAITVVSDLAGRGPLGVASIVGALLLAVALRGARSAP